MDRKAQWALVGAVWFLVIGVVGLGWYTLVYRGGGSAVGIISDAVCPVTGERLNVDEQTPRVRYQGKDYYFSSAKDSDGFSARDRFLMNPQKYLGESQ